MFGNQQENPAQFADRLLKFTTLGIFILSFSYASGAAQFFVSAAAAEYFKVAKTVFALLGAGVVLPFFIKFVRMKKTCRASSAELNGYIIEVYRKSCEYSFAVTLVFLILFEPVAANFLVNLPLAFFVYTTLMVMILSLSISFFLMSRDDDGELDNEFEEPKE